MTFRGLLAVVTVADDSTGLADTLRSLQAQADSRWQWCLVTGGDRRVFDEVFAWAADDPRVLVADGSAVPAGERLSAALSLVDSTYVCRLEPGDRLDPALVGQVRALPDGEWLYTDEAMAFADGSGRQVWFKPDFCPELVRSQPYPVRSAVLPMSVVGALGGLSPRAGTAQWYDLFLRVLDTIGPPRHLPGPYFRQLAIDEVPVPPWIDGEPADRVHAVGAHCDRLGIEVTDILPIEVRGRTVGQRVVRRRDSMPKVSIVIPTRGGSSRIYGFPRCHVVELVASLWTDDRYPELELVVVYDRVTPDMVLQELSRLTDGAVQLVPFDGPFHFSRKCNEGALASAGDYLCFLNDDMRVVTPDWLHELVTLLDDPSVGAAGPRLLFADGTLQHAGHVYNGGTPGHLLFGHAADTLEMGGIAQLTGERSGVTGACLLMRANDFRAVGGFSDLFPLNYNDVDLCLKIGSLGKRILYTPFAVLDHYESQTRRARIEASEVDNLDRRWRIAMHRDPILNPIERMPTVPRPDALEF